MVNFRNFEVFLQNVFSSVTWKTNIGLSHYPFICVIERFHEIPNK